MYMRFLLVFLFLCLSTSQTSAMSRSCSKSKQMIKEETPVETNTTTPPENQPSQTQKTTSSKKDPFRKFKKLFNSKPKGEGWPSDYKPLKGFLLEFKPAVFYYQDSTIRHIYGKFAFMAILEMDQSIKHNVHIYLAPGYARSNGKVASTADIDWLLVPISAGLKYVYPVSSYAYLYAKLGPTWFYAKSKMNNHSSYPWVQRISIAKVWGCNVGIGGLVHLGHNFYLDLFFNYLYGKDSFLDPNSNTRIKLYTGGLESLVGLGYKF